MTRTTRKRHLLIKIVIVSAVFLIAGYVENGKKQAEHDYCARNSWDWTFCKTK